MSGRHRSRAGRTLTRVRLALAAVAAGAAALALLTGGGEDVRRTAAAGPPASTAPASTAPQPVLLSPGQRASTAVPVSVDLPSIDVQGSLVGLTTDASGVLVPPVDFAQAGWFQQGTVPGEIGPAVIAGHVDSRDGPAVFYRLEELAVGDQLSVTRSDGRVVRFEVTRVGRYPKAEFPTEVVYGPTGSPELRLITCGGVFDSSRRSYVDNVVVFARMVG